MKKKIVLLILRLFFCLGMICGMSCMGDLPAGINLPVNIYLDQDTAKITISQNTGGSDAAVTGAITDIFNNPVQLKNGQAVSVNNQGLSGLDGNNNYTRTISAASEYLVVVTEPAKFVKTTTIAPPDAFDITSPAAGGVVSLAGFSVTWSSPDPNNLKVELTLRQIINGNEKHKTFGPYTDSGTQTFSAADLASDFFYGKDVTLTITITKIRERQGINGFNAGTLSSRLSNTLVVTPGP